MSYSELVIVQAIVFTIFFIMERLMPARSLPRNEGIIYWWIGINIFALLWMAIYSTTWMELSKLQQQTQLSDIESGLLLYVCYSFVNYWWHRFKHKIPLLWRVVHCFHHFPSKMETILAFFRHPIEIVLNTTLIGFLAWFLSFPLIAIAIALIIEGVFEIYHHSNIKTPRSLYFICHLIQTTEMHLIHHQRGLHRYNYGTISFWDGLFGTKKIPVEWKGQQGLDLPFGIKGLFLCKK